MKINISSKYQETKNNIILGIKNNKLVSLEDEANKHCCYLCGEKINGKMHIVLMDDEIKGRYVQDKYFIDDKCYQSIIKQIKNNKGYYS